ncbi:MAG: TetR/AcrR family transcriptional regulator [Caulobacterales bacterium]
MTAAEPVTPLREAQKALTRDRIVEAAFVLVLEGEIGALTFARVAEAAGMTERTIYRHFATRDELLAALWARINAALSVRDFAANKEALVAQPKHVFPQFDAQENLMRAILSSPEGHALRRSVNAQRQVAIRKIVKDSRPDLDDAGQARIAAAVQALNSAFGWLVMKDYGGLDAQESARAASEAIALLLTPVKNTDAKGKSHDDRTRFHAR